MNTFSGGLLPFLFSIHLSSLYLPLANFREFRHQCKELCAFFCAELGKGFLAQLPCCLPHGQRLRFAAGGEVHDAFAFVGRTFAEANPAFFFVVFADVEHGLFGDKPFVGNLLLCAGLVLCLGGSEGVQDGVVVVAQAQFFDPGFDDGIYHADFFAEFVKIAHLSGSVSRGCWRHCRVIFAAIQSHLVLFFI